MSVDKLPAKADRNCPRFNFYDYFVHFLVCLLHPFSSVVANDPFKYDCLHTLSRCTTLSDLWIRDERKTAAAKL